MSIVEPIDGYYPITALHRNDVIDALDGKITFEELGNNFMLELAERMEEDYLNQMFWLSLKLIATEMIIEGRKQ